MVTAERWRGRRRMLTGMVSLCCLAASFVGLLAYLSRTDNRYVVAVASFAPILMLMSLVGAAVAAAGFRWVLCAASVVPLLVAATLFGPLYLPGPTVEAATGESAAVRVMQANLMLGLADPNEVVRLVDERAIDVLTVQELTHDAESALDESGLGALLPYRFTRPTTEGGGGAGIYSRYPVSGERELPTFVLSNLAADLDVGLNSPLRVYSVHPVPPYPTPATLWASEMELLHRELVDATGRANVLVSGDFNSTRSHSRFRDLLSAGYEDAADRTGSGIVPTYPTDKSYPPLVGIDHILTRGAAATELQRITVPGSDHHGLVSEVSLSHSLE